MINRIKQLLSKLVPKRVVIVPKQMPASGYAKLSFSQEGEDMLLDRFFVNQKTGFYVDIGAHHPERFSNTHYYYLRGWRGINVEADPELLGEFLKVRSKDINISAAIGSKKTKRTFYVFNETALNTFDKILAEKRNKHPDYSIKKKVILEVLPLSVILNEYMPPNTRIDFMTVDVEGLDYEVLKSNDWEKFRPRFLLVECLKKGDVNDLQKDKVVRFLKARNYAFFAKSFNTVFFKDLNVTKK